MKNHTEGRSKVTDLVRGFDGYGHPEPLSRQRSEMLKAHGELVHIRGPKPAGMVAQDQPVHVWVRRACREVKIHPLRERSEVDHDDREVSTRHGVSAGTDELTGYIWTEQGVLTSIDADNQGSAVVMLTVR